MNQMTECVCQHDGEMCDSEWTPEGDNLPWVCTREDGHDGPHVACGVREHEMAEWTEEAADDE